MKKYLLVLLLAALTACTGSKETVDEVFLQSSDIQLRIDGNTLHTYDPLTWQLGFNRDKKEYRVLTDDMGSYYTLTCSDLPTQVDQRLSAALSWTSGSGVRKESGLSMRVVKTEADGTVWLWCNDKKIGVSVRTLR